MASPQVNQSESSKENMPLLASDARSYSESMGTSRCSEHALMALRPKTARDGGELVLSNPEETEREPTKAGELSDDAQKIRRQVEFYFSDENLADDRFLLKQIKGPANLGVPIEVIHAFMKMRVYQPYSNVVAALKDSDTFIVEGEEGHETVKRRHAFNASPEDADISNSAPKKKEKRSKGAKAIGAVIGKKGRGTGFEDWFCDAPITPDEHSEEIDFYHYSRSFVERIELCIQRYRVRRNLNSFRSNVFDKYLTLGGVETGIKAFGSGGMDEQTLAQYNAAEIADMRAVDSIGRGTGKSRKFFDPDASEDWSVDFVGIVKAFLSHKAPRLFGIDTLELIKSYTAVIKNFLNYVLSHSVCPEYVDQLLAARKICDLAEVELWAIKQLGSVMPGDFNKAASTLFGGYYEKLYIEDASWAEDGVEGESLIGISPPEADRIFKTTIALVGSNDQYDALVACNMLPTVITRKLHNLEVVEIIMPDEETLKLFEGTQDFQGLAGKIHALGKMVVREWDNPEADDEDLTEEEEIAKALKLAQCHLHTETQNLDPGTKEAETACVTPEYNITLFVEADLLSKMFIGLKFACTLHTLDIGVVFFDGITGIFTSFHTYLPNEMMSTWKEPKLNNRPPPCVGAEDRGFDDEDAAGDGSL